MDTRQFFKDSGNELVDRADRLRQTKSSPGFFDLFKISEALLLKAADECVNFQGWDKDQIVLLKVRAQVAQEHHNLLFAIVNDIIAAGNLEAENLRVEKMNERTPQQEGFESDELRSAILEKFDNDPRFDTEESVNEIRVSGSY